MKLHLDESGYVSGYTISCLNYEDSPGTEYTGDTPDDFVQTCKFYKLIDDVLVLDENKWNTFQQELQEHNLKAKYIPSTGSSLESMVKLFIKTAELDDDAKIQASGLYEDWEAGSHKAGDVRNATGQTWECYQAHDSAIYPDIKPGNSAWYTFWRPLHGKSAKTARPFVPVQGAHDMYHVGEYIVWTDENVYECIQDTNFSPAEYAQAWKLKGE